MQPNEPIPPIPPSLTMEQQFLLQSYKNEIDKCQDINALKETLYDATRYIMLLKSTLNLLTHQILEKEYGHLRR